MNGLFNEIKRRNVLRVGGFYLVMSWVVLQVADVVFGFLKVPDWSGTLVLGLLALGLPLVLIFAWAFEITPDGIKREDAVDRAESITGQTGRKLNTLTLIVAGVAILLIGAQAFVPGFRRASFGGDAAHPSIAVLPFVNMSSDKEQEYFSDGLSEELLNLLAKFRSSR